MPRNGSGTFAFAVGYPFTTGTVISSSDVNAVLLDIANTFTASLAKNGETTATGNIPMGGFKFTSVGDATARTQYPSTGQIQDGDVLELGSVAGTDTITASLTPSIGSTGYATGQRFLLIPANTNTGATTIAINSLAAKNVFAFGAACAGGELVAGVPVELVYDGTQFNILAPQGTTGTGKLARAISPTFTGTLAAAAGTFSSTLGVTGNFAVNTNKFTVTAASGNTSVAGTLSVTGHVTMESVTSTGATGTGNLVFSASPTFTGTVGAAAITATGTITGNLFSGSGTSLTGVALLGSSNTFTANQKLNDSVQLIFGTGSDAAILHDGTNTTLVNNTGNLQLQTASTNRVVVTQAGTITLNGVNVTDFARLSQSNTFTGTSQTINASGAFLKVTDGTRDIRLNAEASKGSVGTVSAHSFSLFTNNATRLTIDSSGNYAFGAGTVTTTGSSSSEVGYSGLPTATDETPVLADLGKIILATTNVTFPANGSVAFPVGTVIPIYNTTAGSINVTVTTDTLVLAGVGTITTGTLAAKGIGSMTKVASTTWVWAGAGAGGS